MALETAALRVSETVDDTNELEIALAIAKNFSDRWDGCQDKELVRMGDLRSEH